MDAHAHPHAEDNSAPTNPAALQEVHHGDHLSHGGTAWCQVCEQGVKGGRGAGHTGAGKAACMACWAWICRPATWCCHQASRRCRQLGKLQTTSPHCFTASQCGVGKAKASAALQVVQALCHQGAMSRGWQGEEVCVPRGSSSCWCLPWATIGLLDTISTSLHQKVFVGVANQVWVLKQGRLCLR